MKNAINNLNYFFGFPMASAITGFGMFWFYRLFNWNIWASFIISLYVSALMSVILSYKQ